MLFSVSSRRAGAGTLLAFVLWVVPTFAQVGFAGLHISGGGGLDFGYEGQNGNLIGSSHDFGVGGSGTVNGYYYNPNFLSFSATPYYDRGQDNGATASISNARGYNLSSQIFGGSDLPGGVSFGQSWGQQGLYGLPGLSGLTTISNSTGFAVGWSLRHRLGIPSLSASFSDSNSDSSILGSAFHNSLNNKSFGLGTGGYKFAGFPLSFSYHYQHTTSTDNLLSGGGEENTNDTSSNTFVFTTGHKLAGHGTFNLQASRSYMDSSSSEAGESSHSVTDDISASVSSQVWRLPLSGTVEYDDNAYGSLLQQLNTSGQTVPVAWNEPTTRILLMGLSSTYTFPHSIGVTAFVNHQDEWIQGTGGGVTYYGGALNYHFMRFIKGLIVTVGANDSASKAGNAGGGMIANATYLHNFGPWETSANVNYNQNVQTMFAMYTTSGIAYMASVRRHLQNGLYFSIGGGGGRSVFVQQAGTSAHNENINASVSWLRQTAQFSCGSSGGTFLVTNQGLVPVSTPGLSADLYQLSSARSYSANYTNGLIRHMSLSAGWSKFTSGGSGSGVLSNSSSQTVSASLYYTYRKISFYSRAAHLWQGVGSTGNQAVGSAGNVPAVFTNYAFGVSRWFSVR